LGRCVADPEHRGSSHFGEGKTPAEIIFLIYNVISRRRAATGPFLSIPETLEIGLMNREHEFSTQYLQISIRTSDHKILQSANTMSD